jgi:glycosyltransferase involved in cell wall biosynthesis
VSEETPISRARAGVRAGEWLRALDAFLDLPPDHADASAWNDRGMVHQLLGEDGLAAECLARALALDARLFAARANAFYLAEAGRVRALPVPDLSSAIRVRRTWGESPAPQVSVIMPTYNRAGLIRESIESVLRQSFRDFELLVINDGGDREVEALLEEIHEPRLRYAYAEHGGLAHALNVGIAEARGIYLAFLDDDDIYFPDHLERLVAAAESLDGPAVIHADSYQAFQQKDGLGYRTVRRELRSAGNEAKERLDATNPIPVLSFLVPKAGLKKTGGFRTALAHGMDWDLLLRLAGTLPFQHVPEATSEYRTREDASQMTGELKPEKNYWDSLVLYLNRRLKLFSFPEDPAAESSYYRALDLLGRMAGPEDDSLRVFSLRELWRMDRPHRYFCDQGEKHLGAGRRELAQSMFAAALRLNPWEPKAWLGLWRSR